MTARGSNESTGSAHMDNIRDEALWYSSVTAVERLMVQMDDMAL